MISYPQYAEIEGITIFRDDEEPSHFYYLPRHPHIAMDDAGKPEFTFLRYQFPIERPEAEPGGGYLVFTTVMQEDPQLLNTKVIPILQSRLRSEMPTSVVVPNVVLAPVDFTDGEVRLIMIQDRRFVSSVNLGRPSLFGDNTASVAVELPANGAALFYDALKKGASVGAIEYDLTFPIRLPAITIIGRVDSKEVKEAVIGFTREQVSSDDTWGNEESHEVAHRTSIAETMDSMGMIHLEILKGDADVSQEDMESLRAFAFRAMDDFIKEHFLKGGSVETAQDRESQWMSYLQQDVHQHFELNVSYRDVIKRQYSPSAQVNPSFLGVPVDKVIFDIDLGNAPWFFNNLEVTIDTNLDFDKYGDIVHSVVGHLTYDQRRPDGTQLTKRESVVFTKDDNAPKEFKTRIAAVGKDTYNVDVEVNYKSGPTLQAIIKSFNTTTRHLTLDVPNPGVVEIEFSTAPKAFDDQLVSVEAEIDYTDPRNNVPRVVDTIILNKDNPTQKYRRVIYAPWDKSYQHRFTYVLKDVDGNIQRSTTDWVEASSGTQYVNVATPFDQAFNLNIIPAVDWQEVREMVIDLDYKDVDSDYRMQRTLSFTKDTNKMQPWKFLLRNPDQRSFRYKQTLLYLNSAYEEQDWKIQETDGSLKVGNAPFGVVTVEVDPGDVKLGGDVKRMIVQLQYNDPANPKPDTEALMFRNLNTQTWSVTRGPTQTEYTYDVTYFMSDNTRRTLTDQKGTIGGPREFLVIPLPPEPAPA